jgi:hypothetical protein
VIKGLTAEAMIYNMDGKPASGYSRQKIIDVNATSATEAFTLFENSSKLPALSEVHFLKLKLTDADGQLLSENFYWIGNTYLNYTSLRKMPEVGSDLWVSSPKITIARNGVNKLLIYTIINHSRTTAAFGIRAQLLNGSGVQLLPALFSDGYFSLMQGESKILTVEVDPKILDKKYKLDVKAYNN